jgi:hypothetical protein
MNLHLRASCPKKSHRRKREDRSLFSSIIQYPFSGLVTALILCIHITGCIDKSPEAPSWDMQLTVPIIDESVLMHDEIEKDINEGGNLYIDSTYTDPVAGIRIEGSMDTVYPLRDRQIKDYSNPKKTFHLRDYALTIDDSTKTMEFSIVRIWPSSRLLHDERVMIPGFTIEPENPLENNFLPYEGFEYVRIERGTLELELENDLPVPLDDVHVLAGGEGWKVADVTFPGRIDPGESSTERVPLDGRYLGNQLSLRIDLSSPGSEMEEVKIDTLHQALYLSATIVSPFRVEEGRFRGGGISFHGEYPSGFESKSVRIRKLVFREGAFVFTVDNQFDFPLSLELSFEEFYDSPGNPFKFDMDIVQNLSDQRFDIPLGGTTYMPQESGPETYHSFTTFIAVTIENQEQYVDVASSDYISLLLAVNDVSVDSLSGQLFEKVRTDTTAVEIDFPEGIPDTDFSHQTFTLVKTNTSTMPVNFDVSLRGLDINDRIVADFNRIIEFPATKDTDTTVIVDDPELLALLNVFPAKIRSWNAMELLDGTITYEDSLGASYAFSTPLIFEMAESRYEHSPAETIDISDDDQEFILDHLNRASLYMTIENHFPLGMEAQLYFSPDSANLYEYPQVTLPVVDISNGNVDENGRVIEAGTSLDTLDITREQIEKILSNKPSYAGFVLNFPGSGGKEIVVSPEDYINVHAFLEIDVLIGED